MTTNPDKETLNGLVNQLNLPYSIVSTTDDPRELRRRLASVRRIQASQLPVKDQATKIDVAKAFLAAYRMDEDRGKLLGYMGGRLSDIGDYAHDLRQLAPVLKQALSEEVQKVSHYLVTADMHADLTEEEKGYLSKVLKTSIRSVKQYAVASSTPVEPARALQLLSRSDQHYPTVADTWAAACAVTPGDTTEIRAALVPGPLAEHLRTIETGLIYVDVTQLDRKDRQQVAVNLQNELRTDSSDALAAITRAFA